MLLYLNIYVDPSPYCVLLIWNIHGRIKKYSRYFLKSSNRCKLNARATWALLKRTNGTCTLRILNLSQYGELLNWIIMIWFSIASVWEVIEIKICKFMHANRLCLSALLISRWKSKRSADFFHSILALCFRDDDLFLLQYFR